MVKIIIFSLLVIVGFGFFGYNIWKVRSNILLGREVNRSDNFWARLKLMTLVAFGQKKMFSKLFLIVRKSMMLSINTKFKKKINENK